MSGPVRAWADAESNSEILQPTVVLGPFKPIDTQTPDHVVFTPLTYPVGTARIPRIDLLLVPQPAAGLAALQAGTASWMRALPADQARTARADGRVVRPRMAASERGIPHDRVQRGPARS